jgi:hypothetical protein
VRARSPSPQLSFGAHTRGAADVISIPKVKQNYRLLYDTKGRFAVHSIPEEEAHFKLTKVKRVALTGAARLGRTPCFFFPLPSLAPWY